MDFHTQGNFTICTHGAFAGVSKRNPAADDDNPERGRSLAFAAMLRNIEVME